jgi:hypothetical protein
LWNHLVIPSLLYGIICPNVYCVGQLYFFFCDRLILDFYYHNVSPRVNAKILRIDLECCWVFFLFYCFLSVVPTREDVCKFFKSRGLLIGVPWSFDSRARVTNWIYDKLDVPDHALLCLCIYIYKNECVSVNKSILWGFFFCFLYLHSRMFFSSHT